MRILVVEDEIYRHLQFVKNLLGHSVVVVNNSRDAIELLRDHGHWDVLFLDHDLTNGNGNGMKVVDYLTAEWSKEIPECDLPGKIIVHSLNYEMNGKMYQNLVWNLPQDGTEIRSEPGNFGKL